MDNKKSMASILLIGGFLLLSASVAFRLISILRGVLNGDGIPFFDALYISIKAIIEVLMTALLIAIAWGWLLNVPKYKKYFLGIIIFVTTLNIAS